MIKIENVETAGWQAAIRGMRNPLNSWDKSDSCWCAENDSCYICPSWDKAKLDCSLGIHDEGAFAIGPNDHSLMMRLRNAGKDHRKFMRMIQIYMDITAPTFWWLQFDTYKVGTVKDSCSKMHCIHIKEITWDDFSAEGIREVGLYAVSTMGNTINTCEWLRQKFNDTHEKKYFRALIELLPESYNLRATVSMDYEVAANMYQGRRAHKIQEWHNFCAVLEQLPYSELITGESK